MMQNVGSVKLDFGSRRLSKFNSVSDLCGVNIDENAFDPLKNGVLAVQTIRNNIMASTLLATTAITLSSIISVFVSSASNSNQAASQIVYGNKTPLLSSVKHFAILLCFLVAFLCNVQSIRYYAHVSFLATVPTFINRREPIKYVARNLNRGSLFWSIGLRAFYFSFPLFLWIFGPIPMFICCIIMSFVLYFLDTTTSFTRNLHSYSIRENREKTEPGEIEVPEGWSDAWGWSCDPGGRAFNELALLSSLLEHVALVSNGDTDG
ncbi:hypothetical protein Tco_1165644 [Tanacetum coccineum]